LKIVGLIFILATVSIVIITNAIKIVKNVRISKDLTKKRKGKSAAAKKK
jgi:hypothetical protein